MLERIDIVIIRALQKIQPVLSRVALFIVFFWFGALKIFSVSAANPLVEELLSATFSFISPAQFIISLGIFEMVIGLLFLFPSLIRVAIPLLIIHMIMTLMPLILLPELTWQSSFVPTLEGQYIIKNLVIIALAFGLASRLTPFKR